jgi:predicted nucleic-acid-binding protein
MIGVDTNLLARLIFDDDPAQTPVVERVMGMVGVGGIYVNLMVTAELAWVLKRAYRERPAQILDIIGELLQAREFTVQRPELVQAALTNARSAGCGYADALIELINLEAGAEATLTFDVKAKRLPTMRDAGSYK